jgi:hypothetical protein
MPSAVYGSPRPDVNDPYRYRAGANSHNHHSLHPWGEDVVSETKEFNALYAQAKQPMHVQPLVL